MGVRRLDLDPRMLTRAPALRRSPELLPHARRELTAASEGRAYGVCVGGRGVEASARDITSAPYHGSTANGRILPLGILGGVEFGCLVQQDSRAVPTSGQSKGRSERAWLSRTCLQVWFSWSATYDRSAQVLKGRRRVSTQEEHYDAVDGPPPLQGSLSVTAKSNTSCPFHSHTQQKIWSEVMTLQSGLILSTVCARTEEEMVAPVPAVNQLSPAPRSMQRAASAAFGEVWIREKALIITEKKTA
eukprot:3807452-Rhodomonas_salina.1